MKKSLAALAFGTFGLGISEFLMMGLLPVMASDFGISIPQAGHFITAYALGVCIGAPLIALIARRWPLRRIILVLFGIYSTAALLVATCPADKPWMMLLFRALAGFPHGAYFGASSIIADKLSDEGHKSSAIAIVSLGMAVANLIGIPVSTFIATSISWRVIFYFSAAWGLITLAAIWRWIPVLDPLPDTGLKGQFTFLKSPAPWLIIFATMMGNAGIFCWYSYISPMLTDVCGIAATGVSLVMVLAGAGMVAGNRAGGVLADRLKPGHTGLYIDITIIVTLLLIFICARNKAVVIPLTFVATACLFAVSSPEQLLILKNSEGGQLMGGAMVQIAFNLGNALGSYAGGLPIDAGLGCQYSALVGLCLAVLGTVAFSIFCAKFEKI